MCESTWNLAQNKKLKKPGIWDQKPWENLEFGIWKKVGTLTIENGMLLWFYNATSHDFQILLCAWLFYLWHTLIILVLPIITLPEVLKWIITCGTRLIQSTLMLWHSRLCMMALTCMSEMAWFERAQHHLSEVNRLRICPFLVRNHSENYWGWRSDFDIRQEGVPRFCQSSKREPRFLQIPILNYQELKRA